MWLTLLFWVVYSTPTRKQVIPEKELHRSLQGRYTYKRSNLLAVLRMIWSKNKGPPAERHTLAAKLPTDTRSLSSGQYQKYHWGPGPVTHHVGNWASGDMASTFHKMSLPSHSLRYVTGPTASSNNPIMGVVAFRKIAPHSLDEWSPQGPASASSSRQKPSFLTYPTSPGPPVS